MSVVFFAPGMAGAATRRGAGIHALSNVHRRTPAQSGSSRQVAAGYRMTAAVGGNPCKRLQAMLAPCGSLSQISGGAAPWTRSYKMGGAEKTKSPFQAGSPALERAFEKEERSRK